MEAYLQLHKIDVISHSLHPQLAFMLTVNGIRRKKQSCLLKKESIYSGQGILLFKKFFYRHVAME
jgi:hypothetical protein